MLGQLTLFKPDENLPLRRRVQVKIISTSEARYMLEKFHYLHRTRVGRQLNYAVIIDGMVDGVITFAYPMMSAEVAGIPSDEMIEFARMYLHQNIPHSATCAIGKTLKRVQQDWMTYFPDSKVPRLVISWSDTVYHKGTIYKAANFQHYRRRKGAPPGNKESSKRGKREQHTDYSHEKDSWIYRLPPNNRVQRTAEERRR